MAYNVLIVEDQDMPRQLFEIYVNSSEIFHHLLSVKNASSAISICRNNTVDLILMDVLTELGQSGLIAAEEIKKEFPDIRIIIVTSMPEYSWLERAKNIGVDSFWYKEGQKESILDVMERTMRGERIYPDQTPLIPIGNTVNHDFTDRELDILKELTSGDSNAVIGERLHISAGTVKSHVQHGESPIVYTDGIDILAMDTSNIRLIAGAIDVSPAKAGVGVTVAVIDNKNTVLNEIGETCKLQDDSKKKNPIRIAASETVEITIITVAASVTYSDASFTGGGAVNVVLNDAAAKVLIGTGTRINFWGDVQIGSYVNSNILMLSLGMAVGEAKVAVGGTVAVIINDTTAITKIGDDYSDSGYVYSRNGGLTIEAINNEQLISAIASASAAGGGNASIAGAVSVIISDAAAKIQLYSNLSGQDYVNIIAGGDSELINIGAALGLLGSGAAIGATVLVNILEHQTIIDGALLHSMQSKGDIVIAAEYQERDVIIGLAAGVTDGSVGLAGTIPVFVSRNRTEISLGSQADLSSYGSVEIAATNDYDLLLAAGGIGFGQNGFGASIGTVVFSNTVKAMLDGGRIDAYYNTTALPTTGRKAKRKGVYLGAVSNERIIVAEVSAAGASGVAIGGTVATVVVKNQIRSGNSDTRMSSITVGQTVPTAEPVAGEGDVHIEAEDDTELYECAGALAAAGNVGVGATVVVLVYNKNVSAEFYGTIMSAHDIIVKALNQDRLFLLAASFGAAGTAGIAGDVSVLKFENTTNAYLYTPSGSISKAAGDMASNGKSLWRAGARYRLETDSSGTVITEGVTDLTLTAGNQIGTEESPILMLANTVRARASGDIWLNNLRNLIIDYIVSDEGNIYLKANGTIRGYLADYISYGSYNLSAAGTITLNVKGVHGCTAQNYYNKNFGSYLNWNASDLILIGVMSFSRAEFSTSVSNLTYTGQEILPGVKVYATVNSGGNEILLDEDKYVVEYFDNLIPGTATVKITCMGIVEGGTTLTFTINKAPISKAVISDTVYAYRNGLPVKPEVTAYVRGNQELSKAYYTVTYANNTGISSDETKASVTVTGQGYYTGSVVLYYTIYDKEKNETALNIGLCLKHNDYTGSDELNWGSVDNADAYRMYYKEEGFYQYKLLHETTGYATSTDVTRYFLWTHKNYMLYVEAYIGGECVGVSDVVLWSYPDTFDTTNVAHIEVEESCITINDLDEYQIHATAYSEIGKYQLAGVANGSIELFRYFSADESIARVSADGEITGTGTGITYVYVMAPNGVKTAIRVDVDLSAVSTANLTELAETTNSTTGTMYLNGNSETTNSTTGTMYLNGNSETTSSTTGAMYLNGNSETTSSTTSAMYLNGNSETTSSTTGAMYLNGNSETTGNTECQTESEEETITGSSDQDQNRDSRTGLEVIQGDQMTQILDDKLEAA